MTRAGVVLLAALVVATALVAAITAQAQQLEPRAYSNTPVGMNFLILGYGFTTGDVSLDTSLPVEDAKFTVHSAFLAYARALDVGGRSGKLDLVLPYAWLSGSTKIGGRPVSTEVSGLGDPQVRFSYLFYGAPALTLDAFDDYTPDLIIGGSLAVTAPLGQYDSDRLVNIGTNRWSFKPELGISKTFGPVTLELEPSATFYTDNESFFGGRRVQRDPLYAVQGHVIYHTRHGLWAALDATYYGGGRSTIGGVPGESLQTARVGGTLAIPIDRHNSIKLSASTGAYARVGGNFTTAAIAWQFRWGGGL
jgi:Putative MetA-pathway of phenol degradation